jgi:hypothetical protein
LQARQLKHFHIELRNKSQVALLAQGYGGCDSKHGIYQRLVVRPKMELTNFTKMAK